MAKKKNIEKRKFELLKFTPVEIIWFDSCDVGSDKVWHSDEEVTHITGAFEIHTIGYLISYDEETDIIRVARSYSSEDSQQEGLFDIPLGCVKDFKIIKGIKRRGNDKKESKKDTIKVS